MRYIAILFIIEIFRYFFSNVKKDSKVYREIEIERGRIANSNIQKVVQNLLNIGYIFYNTENAFSISLVIVS